MADEIVVVSGAETPIMYGLAVFKIAAAPLSRRWK
jgi:hypothetical protein